MIKQIVLHHNFIKLASCIIGYSLWAFIAQYQTVTITEKIPLCFYQHTTNNTITAPESIILTISGKRKDLYYFDPTQNAFHINASNYQPGTHHIDLTKENLFLPNSIKLVHLLPSHVTLEVTKPQDTK